MQTKLVLTRMYTNFVRQSKKTIITAMLDVTFNSAVCLQFLSPQIIHALSDIVWKVAGKFVQVGRIFWMFAKRNSTAKLGNESCKFKQVPTKAIKEDQKC